MEKLRPKEFLAAVLADIEPLAKGDRDRLLEVADLDSGRVDALQIVFRELASHDT